MELLKQFLTETQESISIFGFIVNFSLTFFLTYILSYIYKIYGSTISDRKAFSKNFIFIGLTTMLIITIVKSSLALSLGLVGALSIIRFRTAIKEPEELSFLFIAISIGIGFGANQTIVTIVGFLLLSISLIILLNKSDNISDKNNMYLEVTTDKNLKINKLKDIVMDNCQEVELKRYDRSNNSIEFLYIIKLKTNNHLEILDDMIKELDPKAKISFLDNNTNSL